MRARSIVESNSFRCTETESDAVCTMLGPTDGSALVPSEGCEISAASPPPPSELFEAACSSAEESAPAAASPSSSPDEQPNATRANVATRATTNDFRILSSFISVAWTASRAAKVPQSMDGFRFSTDLSVRFSETDAQGVAHNAVYLVWFEIGRIAYLGQFEGGYKGLVEQGVDATTTEAYVRYLDGARFDDELTNPRPRQRSPRSALSLRVRRRADERAGGDRRRRMDGACLSERGDTAADAHAGLAH